MQNHAKLCETTQKLRKTTQNQELHEIENMRNHAQHMKPCETKRNLS